MKTEKQAHAEAVLRFIEIFEGDVQFRDNEHSWAILCDDNKWRPTPSQHFEQFLLKWSRGRFGRHIHCGQSSDFKQAIQTIMVGYPRLSQWQHDSRPVESIREFYDFDTTRSQYSR